MAVQLEDTLVTGYTKLAAETPRRRTDIELRLLDICFASVFGLLLLPVAAVIALLVLVTSGRPVLYRGERVGRHGHFFAMLKFRTLKRDAESRLGPYLGEELVRLTDGRVHADRPLAEGDAARRDPAALGRAERRHVVRRPATDPRRVSSPSWRPTCRRTGSASSCGPGLTGLAQVRRGYETSMAEKLAHDLEWVADRSVPLYLRTLFATGVRVVRQTFGRRRV